MLVIFLVYAFLISICLGSFVNLYIYRYKKGIQVTKGRSFCDYCKKALSKKSLIPLLSYIYYKGKSKCCKKKLNIQDFIVELTTGTLGIVIFYFYKNTFQLQINFNTKSTIISLFILITTLSITFFYDIKHKEIPPIPVLICYISLGIVAFNTDFKNTFLQVLITFILFFLLFVITRGKGMGFGDVYFAPLLAGFLALLNTTYFNNN